MPKTLDICSSPDTLADEKTPRSLWVNLGPNPRPALCPKEVFDGWSENEESGNARGRPNYLTQFVVFSTEQVTPARFTESGFFD
jgi:hypothetical protein